MVIDFLKFKNSGIVVEHKPRKAKKQPSMSEDLVFLHDTINEMLEALLFYADSSNYHVAIGKDFGAMAQLALYGKKSTELLTSEV